MVIGGGQCRFGDKYFTPSADPVSHVIDTVQKDNLLLVMYDY